MRLVLDWDEDTADAVMTAIAAYICGHILDGDGEPGQERTVLLRKALPDLLPADDSYDGIYPVRELFGAHEARLLKEDG